MLVNLYSEKTGSSRTWAKCLFLGVLLKVVACGHGNADPDQIAAGNTGGTGGSSSQNTNPCGGEPLADVTLPDPPAFKVVGYFPSWAGTPGSLQYDKLNFVNYSFALPTKSGQAPVQNACKLAQVVSLAHRKGVRVLLAVGGWNEGDDSAFEQITANPELRKTFVDALMTHVDTYKLDGIDLDWEYPEGEDAANFAALAKELADRLHPQKKFVTAAVPADQWNGDGVSAEAMGYLDFLNIMAYDAGGASGHSPYSYAEAGLDRWTGAGLPAAKAIVGVPFYSRPGYKTFSEIVAQNPENAQRDSVQLNDSLEWYNGIPTIQEKTRLAKQRGGGVMIWDLSQDAKGELSLLTAINSAK